MDSLLLRSRRSAFGSCVLATLLVAIGSLGSTSSAFAGGFQTRPQDSIWIVSTRCLHRCPAPGEAHALSTMRYEGGSWQTRNFSDLAAETSPDRIDVLFVHGNRVEPNEVGKLICQIYGGLTACDGPAVRLIFWSWPSDEEHGPVRDILSKDERSYLEIAWLREALSGLPHLGVRSLVGYSFGARIVAAATATYEPVVDSTIPEEDAVVAEVPSQQVAVPRPPQRAILIAGALDRCLLFPGGGYSRAYDRIDRLSVWFNQADPALRHYGLLDRGAQALGEGGLPNWSAVSGSRIDQSNVTNWIGRTHWLSEYLESPSALGLLRRQSLWEDEAGMTQLAEREAANVELASAAR